MSGLNDFAENVELREGLRKEFPASLVSKLPATSKRPSLDYVGHAPVTDRLNREAPGWTYELTRFIEFKDANGLEHVMAVYGYMQIGSVKRWEVGEADGLAEYGRELKGCISDFIRRAAMRFGVALDLWSKEDLHNDSAAPSPAATVMGGPVANANRGQGSVTSPPDTESARAAQRVAPPTLSASDQETRTVATGSDRETRTDGAPAGDAGTTAELGEAVESSTPAGAPIYLSKDDQALLGTQYGSKAKALLHYKKRYGERLNSVADITYAMRDEMEAIKA